MSGFVCTNINVYAKLYTFLIESFCSSYYNWKIHRIWIALTTFGILTFEILCCVLHALYEWIVGEFLSFSKYYKEDIKGPISLNIHCLFHFKMAFVGSNVDLADKLLCGIMLQQLWKAKSYILWSLVIEAN